MLLAFVGSRASLTPKLSPTLSLNVYHSERINYSINSQKYYRYNQFHYSHVITSGELQDCNWDCNCNVINSSESEPLLLPFGKETESQTDNT